MKVYLVKYALTAGIQIVDAERRDDGGWRIANNYLIFRERDCFERFDDAQEEAEKLRNKKLASMRKNIDKLQALNFTQPKA